jgi:AGZA family xanthine/uracil permease-like MFS transporter
MPVARFFKLAESGTSVRTEIVAGATTFAALSYIIFVQPAVLSGAGMDFGAVMVATCVAAAFATALMGLVANYPIAIAPAMGHNFFFVFVVTQLGVPWRVALGADFLAAVLFVLLAAFRFREAIVDAVPPCLKAAIPVGIGLLIAFVGLRWGGIVVASPGSLVKLGRLTSPAALLALAGFLLIGVLQLRRVPAAILIGIVAATAAGALFGLLPYGGVVARPPSLAPTFVQLDVLQAMSPQYLEIVLVFLFLAVFDTVGTLIGVGTQAGLVRDGRLPRAGRALLADATGTVVGTLLGTSTVTAYVESAAGVAAGGRTGLSNLVTAALLVAALFLYPLARLMGGGVPGPDGATLYPVTAAALMSVGALMMRNVTAVRWDDPADAIPAFLTITVMPLSLSIGDGLAFGFISYAALRALTGRAREVGWVAFLLAGVLALKIALA